MGNERDGAVLPWDWSDCIVDGPMMGEVGYLGDIDHLLEYPCNCSYCREDAEDQFAREEAQR
jgi:hypothetical protein